jgi:hypothetical protein
LRGDCEPNADFMPLKDALNRVFLFVISLTLNGGIFSIFLDRSAGGLRDCHSLVGLFGLGLPDHEV